VGLSGCKSNKNALDNNSAALEVQSSSADEAEDWAKEILADGKITDEELAYAKEKEQECYIENNAKISYDEYGYLSISVDKRNPDNYFQEVLDKCNKKTGTIVQNYYTQKQNPNNENIYQLQTKCAIEVGLAPKEMVLDDLMKMYENHSFTWDANDIRWERCAKDPLGTVTGWKK
jgi:hypothetical protein